MVTGYIGKDVHSKVYKGHYRNSEEVYAVKVFVKPSQCEKEFRILRSLSDCPNVVNASSVVEEKGRLIIPADMRGGECSSEMKGTTYMCMELCSHGDLASLIKAGDGIEKEKLLKSMFV